LELSPEQFELLCHISDREGFPLEDAPSKAGVASTLVAEGLVLLKIVQSPWGVNFELEITPSGKEVIREMS
jgi:hypothetical protein